MSQHLYGNRQLGEMQPINLGLYKLKKNATSHPEADKNWRIFTNINKPKEQKIWYFKCMMEKAALRKYDLITDQDLVGTENDKQFKLPLKVLHTMHFMTYTCTTELEMKETITMLRDMNNKNGNEFIATIQTINYCATRLGNIHSKLLNKLMKMVEGTFSITYPEFQIGIFTVLEKIYLLTKKMILAK